MGVSSQGEKSLSAKTPKNDTDNAIRKKISKRFSNLTGRVRLGRVMLCPKFQGSGRVIAGEIRVTRGSGHRDPRVFAADPRTGPTDLARGSVLLQTCSCPTEGQSRDPRVRPAGSKLMPPLARRPISGGYFELQAHIIPCRTIAPGISDEASLLVYPGSDEAVVFMLTSIQFHKPKQAHTHMCW